MATLTPQLLSELVRLRLGEENSGNSVRFVSFIPQALRAMARKVAADPYKRNLLIKQNATLPIGDGGIVDLNNENAENNFLIEFLDCGQIYHEDSDFPLQFLKAHQKNLVNPFVDVFIYCFLEGTILTVLGKYTGNLTFNVPFYPRSLQELPDNEELHNILIDKIIELSALGTDLAEDGKK